MKLHKEIPSFSLKPDDIHVWLFNLDTLGQDFPGYGLFLAQAEIRCSKRYCYEYDSQRFVARRSLLRLLLGHYCGLSPEEITYQINRFGKLSLSSQAIRFNLSACQNMVAFAFSLEKEVGVDIEQVRLLPELAGMMDRCFSKAEQVEILALAPEMHLDAFYHIWTQKEAFVKAHGEGMSLPWQDFSVSIDPDLLSGIRSIREGEEDLSNWKMYTGVPAAGWRVAVCIQAESALNIRWCMPTKVDFLDFLSL